MMQMYDRETLVGMSSDAIHDHLVDLALARSEVSDRLKFAQSPVGLDQLSKLKGRRKDVRDRYCKIRVDGVQDRDGVVSLIKLITAETVLDDTIGMLENIEEQRKALDEYHKVCESIATQKDKAERTRRK